jgi:hypothetical protein
LNLFSHHLRYCGPLPLAFLGDVADACTNIQQVAKEEEEEEEEEEDTPHVDIWRNARVWVDFFDGLHS